MAVQLREPEDRQDLSQALAPVASRLRRAIWVKLGARGLLGGIAVSSVAVALSHFFLLPDWLPLELVIPISLLVGLAIGTFLAFRRSYSLMAIARYTDSRLNLKERISSALDFETTASIINNPDAAALRRMQYYDAAAHARALNPREIVPIPFSWELKALIAAAVFLIVILVLPLIPMSVPPATRLERLIVQKEGEKLTKTATVIEKQADAASMPQTKHAAQAMESLGKKMSQGKMDKKQAMVQMSQVSQQMQQQSGQSSDGGQATDTKTVPEAGQQLSQNMQQQGTKAMPEVQNSANAMQKESGQELSAQLKNLADRVQSGQMSPSEQQQAARDLQQMSNSLKGTPLNETAGHLQQAAQALKRGDTQRAASELRQAAELSQREIQQARDQQGVQQAQSQLQKSQDEMAQASKPGDIPNSPDSQMGNSQVNQQNAQSGQESNSASQQGQSTPQPESGGQGQQASAGPKQSRDQGAGQSQSKTGQSGDGQSQSAQSQSGQGQSQSADQSSGQSQAGNGAQGGAPGNSNGLGRGAPNQPGPGHYVYSPGSGFNGPKVHGGVFHGAPHSLSPNFNPAQNPKYGKLFLGNPKGSGPSLSKTMPGGKPQTGQAVASHVPYGSYIGTAKNQNETAADREDIPPAYRSNVRQYFNSLQSK